MSDEAPTRAFSGAQLDALRAPLLRANVSTRQQAGRTLSYIEGWHAIAEANRIFGFGAWDRETVECRQVVERATKMGQNKDRDGWRVSYAGKVRITVRAGNTVIVREGTGYGSGIDADLGEAHESAIKECETDSMKRALMTFGNPFGLALYDKEQAEVIDESDTARQDYAKLSAAFRAAPNLPAVASLWEVNKEAVARIQKHGGEAAMTALHKVAQDRIDALGGQG